MFSKRGSVSFHSFSPFFYIAKILVLDRKITSIVHIQYSERGRESQRQRENQHDKHLRSMQKFLWEFICTYTRCTYTHCTYTRCHSQWCEVQLRKKKDVRRIPLLKYTYECYSIWGFIINIVWMAVINYYKNKICFLYLVIFA